VEGGVTNQPDAAVPALVPLTEAARKVFMAEPRRLTRLPFRVGRDLRAPDRRHSRWFRERRSGSAGPNDLYLAETVRPFRISRKHFLIGFDAETRCFFIEDRASSCGTQVGGERIGGDRQGGRRTLRDGDVIRPGGAHSPFAFRFVLPNEAHGSGSESAPTPCVAEWRERE